MSEAGIDGLYRVCVKVYASEHEVEDHAELFVPIFHEWIRARALNLVMLDVADYAHAPASPGIMLICHEVSFALDRGDGRFGILAQRRTPVEGGAVEAIAATVRHVIEVAARLESDSRVTGKLKFDPSVLRVEANDRLLAPNTEEGFEAFAQRVRQGIDAAVGRGEEPRVERVDNDPRDRLAVEAVFSSTTDVQEQLAALTPVLPQGSV